MANSKLAKLLGKIANKNPLETAANVGGVGTAVVDSVKKDLLQASATDMWKQFFGDLDPASQDKGKQNGGPVDMKPGQEFNLTGKKKAEAKSPEKQRNLNILPGLDYRSEIVHTEKLSRRESAELTQKVQEIMVELKRLVDSSTVLQAEFMSVTVEQRPVSVGKYHLHFFEWMLVMIKNARMKVEDSGAWLKTMSSKKKQRQYGSMAKKHGTTFTLSNERVVATQTG